MALQAPPLNQTPVGPRSGQVARSQQLALRQSQGEGDREKTTYFLPLLLQHKLLKVPPAEYLGIFLHVRVPRSRSDPRVRTTGAWNLRLTVFGVC